MGGISPAYLGIERVRYLPKDTQRRPYYCVTSCGGLWMKRQVMTSAGNCQFLGRQTSKTATTLHRNLEGSVLFRSLSTARRGNALLVRALTASGRDAIGARITVICGHHKQIDEVRSGGYFISQGDFRVHFGLGSSDNVAVTIRWPQGATETFKDVLANQSIVVREGKGIVERHPLPPSPKVPLKQ